MTKSSPDSPNDPVLGVLTGQVPVRSAPIAMSEPEDTEDEDTDS